MFPQNTGVPTRFLGNHGTAPDITACGIKLDGQWSRRIADGITDHLRIEFEVPAGCPVRPPRRRMQRYIWKKANWKRYSSLSDKDFAVLLAEHSAKPLTGHAFNKRLTAIITKAARRSIPYVWFAPPTRQVLVEPSGRGCL